MHERTTKTEPGSNGMIVTVSEQERPDGHIVTHKFSWPGDQMAHPEYLGALENHKSSMDFLFGLPEADLLTRAYRHCVKPKPAPSQPPPDFEL